MFPSTVRVLDSVLFSKVYARLKDFALKQFEKKPLKSLDSTCSQMRSPSASYFDYFTIYGGINNKLKYYKSNADMTRIGEKSKSGSQHSELRFMNRML